MWQYWVNTVSGLVRAVETDEHGRILQASDRIAPQQVIAGDEAYFDADYENGAQIAAFRERWMVLDATTGEVVEA